MLYLYYLIMNSQKILYIPPNLTNVIISNNYYDKIQATGKDQYGKTQYIYHPLWNLLSTHFKYIRLKNFTQAVKKHKFIEFINTEFYKIDNMNTKYNQIIVLFKILMTTFIRVGTEKQKNTGLTTMKTKHIRIKENKVIFDFVGKSNKEHHIEMNDEHLSMLLTNHLKTLSSQNIFSVSATELNKFLKDYIGNDFTVKDIRTYGSNYYYLLYLQENLKTLNVKKAIAQSLEETAEIMGHTKAMTKSKYVFSDFSNPENINKSFYKIKDINTFLMKNLV